MATQTKSTAKRKATKTLSLTQIDKAYVQLNQASQTAVKQIRTSQLNEQKKLKAQEAQLKKQAVASERNIKALTAKQKKTPSAALKTRLSQAKKQQTQRASALRTAQKELVDLNTTLQITQAAILKQTQREKLLINLEKEWSRKIKAIRSNKIRASKLKINNTAANAKKLITARKTPKVGNNQNNTTSNSQALARVVGYV